MKKIAIIVGHYGPGTGAKIGSRDEFILNSKLVDKFLFESAPERDGFIPILVSINERLGDWKIIQSLCRRKFGGVKLIGNRMSIDFKVEKIRTLDVSAAIEFHLNRYRLNTLFRRRAEGNEVFIRRKPNARMLKLGELLEAEMANSLGNRRRGLKRRNFRILRNLPPHIPAAIIEPAFLAEDRVVSIDWQAQYLGAIRKALSLYFDESED